MLHFLIFLRFCRFFNSHEYGQKFDNFVSEIFALFGMKLKFSGKACKNEKTQH